MTVSTIHNNASFGRVLQPQTGCNTVRLTNDKGAWIEVQILEDGSFYITSVSDLSIDGLASDAFYVRVR